MQNPIPILLLLLAPSFAVFSRQPVRITSYTTANGMLSNTTYSALFDRNDYLWVCTDRGLSRFDGVKFTHFTVREGLPDNDIIRVVEDGNGTIWAEPFLREVAFLQPGKSVFTNISTLIPADTVKKDGSYSVHKLRNGGVALLTEKGVIRVIRKGKWVNSHYTGSLAMHWMSFVYESPKGEIVYIDARHEIRIARNGTIRKKKSPYFLYRIEQTRDGVALQMENRRDVLYFNTTTEEITPIHSSNVIHRFASLKHGALLGTADRRLSMVQWGSDKEVPEKLRCLIASGMSNSRGTVDAICTADNGLILKTYNNPGNYMVLGKTIFPCLCDGKPFLAGEQSRCMYPFATSCPTIEGLQFPISPPLVECLKNQAICYGQILTLQDGTTNRRLDTIYYIGAIKDVYLVNDHIRYIAGSHGIGRLDTRTMQFRKLYNQRSIAVAPGPNGSIFIGTHWGLKELRKDGSIRDWTVENHFPPIRITDIAYSDGILWIATAGTGLLAIYKNEVIVPLAEKNNIQYNDIQAIEADDRGHLFVGHSGGGEKLTYTIKNNRLIVRKVMALATFRGESIRRFVAFGDTLWAIGNRGMFVFDTRKNDAIRRYKIDINRIRINNLPQEITAGYELKAGDYDFNITFSSNNFEQFPIHYRYRINEGKWHYTSRPAISYQSLGAGNYRITLQVLNNYYRPSDTKVVTFTIHPPFFRTLFFILPVSFITVFLIGLFIFLRIRSNYRKRNEALLQEKRVNELELIALKAQINPHFVFNSLNSMKALMLENQLDDADRYIDRFARLFRTTLDASSTSFHALSTEISYLQSYLEMEQTGVKGRFAFVIEVVPPLTTEQALIPPMLLQPYVENAVKHGVLPLKNKKGTIRISFEKTGDELLCTIADDGAGRTSMNDTTGQHSGKGIAITAKREQLYRIRSEITDNIPSGTIVRVWIPFYYTNLVNP